MSKIQEAQKVIKKEAPVTKNYEAKAVQIEQQLEDLKQVGQSSLGKPAAC
jgi:hypothetical protein